MSASDRKRVTKMLKNYGWESAKVMERDQGEHWIEGDVVEAALGELVLLLPRFVEKLRTAKHVCTVHHANDDCDPWFLAYLLGDELVLCGPPNPDAKEAEGWKLPAPLRALYAQHDGLGLPCFEFGGVGYDPRVMPASLLDVPDVPDNKDLLRFTRGSGEAGEGGWCFAGKRKQDIVDVEDSHGLRGEPVPFDFWGFLDLYLLDETDDLPEAERF